MSHVPTVTHRSFRRRRWRLTPRFWSLVALVLMVYIASSYVKGFVEIARLRSQIRHVQAEIEAAEARNEELRRELIYLKSDEYIEKTAREELGLVRPGETPVLVTPSAGRRTEGGQPGSTP